ncbi:MAG: hypothetical protein RLZZ631_461, partial [Cyanobacteriota bacterium]
MHLTSSGQTGLMHGATLNAGDTAGDA